MAAVGGGRGGRRQRSEKAREGGDNDDDGGFAQGAAMGSEDGGLGRAESNSGDSAPNGKKEEGGELPAKHSNSGSITFM